MGWLLPPRSRGTCLGSRARLCVWQQERERARCSSHACSFPFKRGTPNLPAALKLVSFHACSSPSKRGTPNLPTAVKLVPLTTDTGPSGHARASTSARMRRAARTMGHDERHACPCGAGACSAAASNSTGWRVCSHASDEDESRVMMVKVSTASLALCQRSCSPASQRGPSVCSWPARWT